MNKKPLENNSNLNVLADNKTKEKKTIRGKAVLNLDDSSSEDSDNGGSGIYGNIIKTTKKGLKATKQKFANDEIIVESVEVKGSSTSDSQNSSSNEQSTESSSDSDSNHKILKKVKKSDISSESPSPPPPITSRPKPKRRSTALDRQLKALEKISTSKLTNAIDLQDFFTGLNDQSNLEEDEKMTIRVSTKSGIKRFEITKNKKFLEIYENLSKIENIGIENLVLTHRKTDNKIKYDDTPETLNIQAIDMIDCEYIKAKAIGRVHIISSQEDAEIIRPDMINVILQTREGRKSRVKFLIAKDEPLKNMISKYCEKLDLDEAEKYILEFDGDVVNSTETSKDLDLDGGEIFDVKKSSKPTMQLVSENKKNYDFDSDILFA